MIKEDLIPILVLVAVMIIVIITAPQTSVTNTDIVETATDVIETATDVVEPEPEIKQPRYNVNLPAEVQDCIIAECEKHGINPDIVIAQIKKESNFNPNNIGDGGNSFGLMQIQPRWHSKRMERLGCTDLFDPIQNVKVGIDYLAEKYREYGDIGLALTAYNSGSARNGLNGYAVAVMESVGEVG